LQQIPLDLGIRDMPTLESFIGSENLLLRAMIAQQSAGGGEMQLVLHGAPGTGKTHLAQAACYHANEQGYTAAYLPLHEFSGQLAAAFDGLEQLQLIVLDNIDVIAGCDEDEFALFDLINRLRENRRRLLLTASRPPRELGIRLPDLVTRLGWGPVLRIHAPTDAEKVDLLQTRARERGFELPFETGMYLLKVYRRDVTELLALLARLDRASLAEQRKLTVPFVRGVLRQGAPGGTSGDMA